jgi:hypothetical protein
MLAEKNTAPNNTSQLRSPNNIWLMKNANKRHDPEPKVINIAHVTRDFIPSNISGPPEKGGRWFHISSPIKAELEVALRCGRMEEHVRLRLQQPSKGEKLGREPLFYPEHSSSCSLQNIFFDTTHI